MRSLHPSKFCFYFSLRQGTICIAVTELTVTAFVLLIVAVMAEQLRQVMGSRGGQDPLDPEVMADVAPVEGQGLLGVPSLYHPDGDDDDYGDEGDESYYKYHGGNYRREESRASILQLLFQVMTSVLYAGVVLSTTHLILCLLLLYGAIRSVPRLLLPWLSTTMVSMVLWTVAAVLYLVVVPWHQLEVVVVAITLLALQLHSWLIVFAHFRQLTAVEACRQANNILPPLHFASKFSTVDI